MVERYFRREDLPVSPEGLPYVEVDGWTLADLQCLAYGAFSPLDGFLGRDDYESVLERMRLADGTVWTIPITLPVSRDVATGLDAASTSPSGKTARSTPSCALTIVTSRTRSGRPRPST